MIMDWEISLFPVPHAEMFIGREGALTDAAKDRKERNRI
jgi:hypothetical protein